ncbi:hypothetical protein AMJ80_11710 [bacterium SM23_31]|nr:MAG: hypothetical protein AMJ80_11710 [bacterium SM23_31]
MFFEYLIAKRYLIQKKETGFITLIMYISIAGLSIGIAALILTLGVLNGFEHTIKEKILSFQSHLRLDAFHNRPIENHEEIQRRILGYSEVAAVSPFIEQACILRYDPQEDGVMIRGIDPAKINSVIDVGSFISEGSIDLGVNADDVPGILLGVDLVERFNISLGDSVILASPPDVSAGIISIPNRLIFELRGTIDTGMSEFDNTFAFIHINEAQSLFKMPGKISGIDIRLHDIALADTIRNRLDKEMGYPLFARTWNDLNDTLFDWLNVQRLPILIAFGMIIMLGAINLVSTLILIVLEKQKDVGILKSIGASSSSIIKIFFIDGIVIGIVAVMSGSILTLILGYIQNKYSIISLSKEVYYVSTFPVDLNWMNFLKIGLVAMILCIGATIYPAWKASRLMPSEAIRSE